MAIKKSKTKNKTTKKKTTKKSNKSHPVTMETIKKREQAGLMRTIDKYERNLTNLVINSYKEGPIFLSELLMISLYPQLMNSNNIHHYREFFMNLQTDNNFQERVSENETYTDLDTELHHYNLYPLLHQKLLEVTRECVNGGYTKKISNSLRQIVDEVEPVLPKGE